jgi:DNA uptake protein ComE-like DNA-binding protein
MDISPNEIAIDSNELSLFYNELDSLRKEKIEATKPKIYPFNPNFITDYKGYTLGMSNEEIDRLLQFRKMDKWVNSTQDFQNVTMVSDSLLNKISPFFKFPEWVNNPKAFKTPINKKHIKLSFDQKSDLNTVTAQNLQKVYGIGEKLSERIVKYRNKFVGGFVSDIQLNDIYGLSPEVILRITNEFTVKTPRPITPIKLNSATVEQLVTIQHIDYELAHEIIETRTLRDGFSSFDELSKIESFPRQKIEIIKLYLVLN